MNYREVRGKYNLNIINQVCVLYARILLLKVTLT